MVIFQFTTGMEEEDLRKHIHFGRAKSMDKAISLAVEWESFSNKDRDRPDAQVKPKAASVETVTPATPLASTMEVLMAKLDRIEEGWKNRPHADKSQVVCYGCRELGHYRRECPNRQNRQAPRQQAPNQGGPPAQPALAPPVQYQNGPPAQSSQDGPYRSNAPPHPVQLPSGSYAGGGQGQSGPAMTGPYGPNLSATAYQSAPRPSAPPSGPYGGQGAQQCN